MIELKSLTPVASGHLRLVFDHPIERDCLIKVMRPEMIAKRWGGARRWYKRLPRAVHYTGFVRELKEYIAIHARFPGANPPIARTLGVVETDFGLGLVAERVHDPRNAPGPTLEALVRAHRGLPAWLDQALDALVADLLRYNVIVGDMHAGNVVFGADSRGGPRLVMIDGFGEKHVVPICTLSRIANQRNTRRLGARLRRKIERILAE